MFMYRCSQLAQLCTQKFSYVCTNYLRGCVKHDGHTLNTTTTARNTTTTTTRACYCHSSTAPYLSLTRPDIAISVLSVCCSMAFIQPLLLGGSSSSHLWHVQHGMREGVRVCVKK